MTPHPVARPTRSLATTRAAAAALVVAVAVAGLPAVAAAPDGPDGPDGVGRRPSVGEPGVGDPYWPLDGNGGIDVRHYDVRVAYAFDTRRLSGTTTLTLRATRDLTRFDLDLLLPVTSVTVDGVDAAAERVGPDGRHELAVTPDEPLRRDQVVDVVVAYAGTPDDHGYAGERNWLAGASEVVTMNEPHMAPWWFAANDHPRDKATFDVTVTGPADLQVVSNGLPVGRRVDGGLATTHWRSAHPMATYLAFFALGRYRVERGRHHGLPWITAVSRDLSRGQQAVARSLLRRTPRTTSWLQGRLGRYPFESTGGLATALPVGFALENQTRPTYPASFEGDPSVVVHELAHQWFGDSVTVRRWSDIWLNEGFASFMEVAYDEAHGGVPGQVWLRDRYRTYASKSAWFWGVDLADPGRGKVFDAAVYVRGAMAVQALRHRLGERVFWRLLRTWVSGRRHGLGSVRGFEQLAARVSGQRLGRFFDAWLRAPRPPARTRGNGLR